MDGDLRDLQIGSGPHGPVLYAATGQNGGLSAFDLAEGGLGKAMPGPVFFAPDTAGNGLGRLTLVPTLDGSRLLLASGPGGALTGYDLRDEGGLGEQTRLALPAEAGRTDALASTRLADGRMAYYLLDAGAGLIGGYVETAPGRLEPLAGALLQALETQKGASMMSVDAGVGRFLVMAGSGLSGPGQVVSYHIDPTSGALEFRDSTGAIEGLGLNTPTAMASATANGVAWVVLGDPASQSLSVLRLGADGSLMPTDYLLDTLDTRFGNVQSVAMLEADGHVFVAAGGGDDGFSLFTLLPNGRLIHVATQTHDIGMGLEDVTALEMARVGGEMQIFAAGEGAAGLSQFTMSLGNLGQVIRDVSPEGRLLSGTTGNDVILASDTPSPVAARDRLEGGAGDDILGAGSGGSDLLGGPGADVFVLGPGKHHILDFELGEDRLDFSSLPFLRNPAQLTLRQLPDGVELLYGDTEIRITSATAAPLTADDLWPDQAFGGPDHLPVGGGAPGQPGKVTGTDGDDRLEGSWVNEIFTGGAGADVFVMTPNMGADTITDFDPNVDRLDFSALDSVQQAALVSEQVGSTRVITLGDSSTLTLLGVEANSAPSGTVGISGWAGTWQVLRADIDAIQDPDGVATIFGYQWMRNGSDIAGATTSSYLLTPTDIGATLSLRVFYMDRLGTHEQVVSKATGPVARARYGTDFSGVMWGGRGNDFLVAGRGDDTVHGQGGGDTLLGGDGADRLLGEAGNDAVFGGGGHDTLWGSTGNDVLVGGLGNDSLLGGEDRDTLKGEAGDDRLWGGVGYDALWGGDGNERIWGGAQGDRLWGDGGNDALWGEAGNDAVFGGGGHDTLWGSTGNDALVGGLGNDSLLGGEDRDTLKGEAGDDRLWGGVGYD
ncbi:hypothetical protein AVO45_18850, partial [Ruegeria marisrubri]